MLDEYEIRLGEKSSRFLYDTKNADRRQYVQRRTTSARRELADRRREKLAVEVERRKEQRRKLNDRRFFEERRVTSNYSQERLEEERRKLEFRKSGDAPFYVVAFVFLGLLISMGYFLYTEFITNYV